MSYSLPVTGTAPNQTASKQTHDSAINAAIASSVAPSESKGRANAIATQLGALSVTAAVSGNNWTVSWGGLRMQVDNIAVAVENLAETELTAGKAIWLIPTAGETTLTAQVGDYNSTLRNAINAGTVVLLVRNQSGALTGPLADQFRAALLQTALDGKAPVDHEQEISTVTGLQDALDGKAPSDHMQAISTVTGLQTALDGKAPHATGSDWRPGLAPGRYAQVAADAGIAGAPMAVGTTPAPLIQRVTGRGDIVRLTTADAILVERDLIILSPETVTEVVAIVRRAANTLDPNGDTVRLGIVWLTAAFGAISTTVLDDIVLTSEMAAWRGAHLISAEADLGADVVAPTGAAYGRLFVKAFGSTGQTDIETLGHHDVTRLAALLNALS